jgi:hypothetical protein
MCGQGNKSSVPPASTRKANYRDVGYMIRPAFGQLLLGVELVLGYQR